MKFRAEISQQKQNRSALFLITITGKSHLQNDRGLCQLDIYFTSMIRSFQVTIPDVTRQPLSEKDAQYEAPLQDGGVGSQIPSSGLFVDKQLKSKNKQDKWNSIVTTRFLVVGADKRHADTEVTSSRQPLHNERFQNPLMVHLTAMYSLLLDNCSPPQTLSCFTNPSQQGP